MKRFIDELLKKNFSTVEIQKNELEDEKIKVAACTLLIEIANADGMFSEEEKIKIIHIMKRNFNINEDYANDLIELAHEEIKESVSIYEFTQTINEYFSREEKLELLRDLWKLIYADGTLDKYEDHLVRRIAGNLKLEHHDIVEAKISARSS